MSTIEEVLSALDDMNADGNLKYDDYSALHDMVSMITLPAETLHARTVSAAEVETGALVLHRADYSRTGRDPADVTHSIWENREDLTAALAAMGIEVVDGEPMDDRGHASEDAYRRGYEQGNFEGAVERAREAFEKERPGMSWLEQPQHVRDEWLLDELEES